MSNERLGIVEERAAARLAWKHRDYRAPETAGKVHHISVNLKTGERTTETTVGDAKPMPLPAAPRGLAPNPFVSPRSNVIDGLLARIAALEIAIAARSARSEELPQPNRNISASAIVVDYLERLNGLERRTPDGFPWTLEELARPTRVRSYAAPRHVLMGLLHRLCPHLSFPMIGKIFDRDHTTAMHGCKRAPFWLDADPELAAVASEVIARFTET